MCTNNSQHNQTLQSILSNRFKKGSKRLLSVSFEGQGNLKHLNQAKPLVTISTSRLRITITQPPQGYRRAWPGLNSLQVFFWVLPEIRKNGSNMGAESILSHIMKERVKVNHESKHEQNKLFAKFNQLAWTSTKNVSRQTQAEWRGLKPPHFRVQTTLMKD